MFKRLVTWGNLNPVKVHLVTGTSMWACGEIGAQWIVDKQHEAALVPHRSSSKSLDVHWDRVGAAAIFGALLAPTGQHWYTFLDRLPLAVKWQRNLAKLVLDLSVFEPFAIATFFSWMTWAEGGNVVKKLEKDFFPTLCAEVIAWTPVQLVNLSLVPVNYQLLVVNIVSLLDSTFLCWVEEQEDWVGTLFPSLRSGNDKK